MLILSTAREKLLAGVVIFITIVALFTMLATGVAADQGMPLSNTADCDAADSEDEGAEPGETILHFVTPQTSDETTPVVTVTYSGTSVSVDASRHTGGVWHIYVSIPFGVDWDAYVTNVTYVGPQQLFLLSHCDEGGQTTTTTTAPTTTTTSSTTTTTQPTTTTTQPTTTTTQPTTTTTQPTTTTNAPTTTTPPTTNPPQTTVPETTTDTLPFTGAPFETSTMLAIAGALMSGGALALFGSRQRTASVAPTTTEPTWKGWYNHQ